MSTKLSSLSLIVSWTHLRLLSCRAVWRLRCCRAAEGQVFTAATVVCGACEVFSCVQRAIRLDWLRVTSDLAGESASLPTWCSNHKRFDLSQADFVERWCLGSVLAYVSMDAAGSAALCVHCPASVWHLVRVVPFPAA